MTARTKKHLDDAIEFVKIYLSSEKRLFLFILVTYILMFCVFFPWISLSGDVAVFYNDIWARIS